MRPSVVAQRVAHRTALALWRKRGTLVLLALGVGVLGALPVLRAPAQVEVAGQQVDCADTVLAYMLKGGSDLMRPARDCLAPEFAAAVPEREWRTLSERPPARNARLERVAERQAPDGAKVVFYLVQQRIGYMVYLDRSGRVTKVE